MCMIWGISICAHKPAAIEENIIAKSTLIRSKHNIQSSTTDTITGLNNISMLLPYCVYRRKYTITQKSTNFKICAFEENV